MLSFLMGINICQAYTVTPDNKKKVVSKADPTENIQVVYSYTIYGEIPIAKTIFEEEHFLGGELNQKWNTLNANYTHVYNVSVGFTNSGTEILKPAIYNAVLKVNKYYRKACRKGFVNEAEAKKQLSHIFDCANVICFENNTENFEKAISEVNKPEQIIALFNQVKLIRE